MRALTIGVRPASMRTFYDLDGCQCVYQSLPFFGLRGLAGHLSIPGADYGFGFPQFWWKILRIEFQDQILKQFLPARIFQFLIHTLVPAIQNEVTGHAFYCEQRPARFPPGKRRVTI